MGRNLDYKNFWYRRMRVSSEMVAFAFLVFCCSNQVSSYQSNNRYSPKEPIPLYANKVGPYFNPSETYAYYDYPFCYSDHVKEKKQSLGESLNGDRLVSSPYKLDFLVDKKSQVACSRKLNGEEVSQFRMAIEQEYYIQLYYDDLPVWVFIGNHTRVYKGKQNDYKYLLYTHIWFNIYYNIDRVVEIKAHTTLASTVDLTEDKEVEVEFVYDVKWKPTDISFYKRMDIYKKNALLPNRIKTHWFSVMDSCLTILILFGFLLKLYIKKLKKDINKYAGDEENGEYQEETGWKSLHGDVFREPIHKSLFAAVVGSGTQLVVIMLLVIMLGVLGMFNPYSRGALITTIVVIYALTSGIAGYSAISLYSQLEGTDWIKTLLLTTFIVLGPLLVTFGILNTVATTYGVTVALPLRAMLALFSIWFFVGLPLTLLGGIFGKYSGSGFRPPCRTNKCAREVPCQRWYWRMFPRMAMGGLMLFCVTYTELNYILATLWGHRIYTTYLFLLIISVVLLVLTSLVAVVYTYSRLAVEEHRWWWRSFLSGGTSVMYMFGYCVYYFYQRSNMYGVVQTTFFFGYMTCLCYGFFLMLGAVGFYSSFFFVRHIYGAIKCE